MHASNDSTQPFSYPVVSYNTHLFLGLVPTELGPYLFILSGSSGSSSSSPESGGVGRCTDRPLTLRRSDRRAVSYLHRIRGALHPSAKAFEFLLARGTGCQRYDQHADHVLCSSCFGVSPGRLRGSMGFHKATEKPQNLRETTERPVSIETPC